jgi:hypothetical protein
MSCTSNFYYTGSGSQPQGKEIIGFANTYGWCWPAQKADGTGTNPDPYAREGCLRAIPPSVDLSTVEFPTLGTGGYKYAAGFEHPFGRICAQACQNYGLYTIETVDAVAYPGSAANSEGGQCTTFACSMEPDPTTGDIVQFVNLFETTYGHPMRIDIYTTPSITAARAGTDNSMRSKWGRDMDRILSLLQIVTNNTPTTIGGGGTPCMPPAPPFSNP